MEVLLDHHVIISEHLINVFQQVLITAVGRKDEGSADMTINHAALSYVHGAWLATLFLDLEHLLVIWNVVKRRRC